MRKTTSFSISAYSWILLICLKGTGLIAQDWSPPVQLYGLWNEVHPFTLVLDENDRGTVSFGGNTLPITLHPKESLLGREYVEMLPDGSHAGTWVFNAEDNGLVAQWTNYNKTIGARSILSTRRQEAPNLQIKLFQFRSADGDWYVFLYPAPPAKWRGVAWSNTRTTPMDVSGVQSADQFFLEFHGQDNEYPFKLTFSADRIYPRFGWWAGTHAIPEKIRFRHRKSISINTIRSADFFGELFVLEPDLDWPSWQNVAKLYLDPALRRYADERAEWKSASEEPRPFQRNGVRCYSWVTWSFLRDDLLSGTLHVATSWGPATQHPFLISKNKQKPLSLQDIWAPWPVPKTIADVVLKTPFSDHPERKEPLLELRPDGLYLWQDQPVQIPTAQLKGSLPKESVLYPYFGK